MSDIISEASTLMVVTPTPAPAGDATLTGSLGSLSGDLGLKNEDELLADTHGTVNDKVDEANAVIPISQILLKIK